MGTNFYELPVKAIIDETPEAYTICFENLEPEFFAYEAGQYLTLRIEIEGEECRRAFSLSSSPDLDQDLHITIKRIPNGKVSNFLRDHLEVGDLIDVMPPRGGFKILPEVDRQRHYIMLGAGSGITPLISMIKTVLHREPLSKISLWYGSRTKEAIIFDNLLQTLQREYSDRLTIYHMLSQPSAEWKGKRGRLDKQNVYELLLDLFMVDTYRKQYFVCGPEAMMQEAKEAFSKHAINPKDVFQEYFNAPLNEDIEGDLALDEEDTKNTPEILKQEVIVELNAGLYSLMVEPEQTILDAAEAADLDTPYTCKAGICTTCRAKLIRGTVHMDESMGLSLEEIENGYVLTCQAHPTSEDVRLSYE